MSKSVLIIGEDPAQIDFSAPDAPPDMTAEKVMQGLNGSKARLEALGHQATILLTKDAETVAIAKTITEVIFNDLAFEREFLLIPRDTYATIPRATTMATRTTMAPRPRTIRSTRRRARTPRSSRAMLICTATARARRISIGTTTPRTARMTRRWRSPARRPCMSIATA